jgi:hypothetical protein
MGTAWYSIFKSAFTHFLSGAPLWTETPTAPADGVVWAQGRAHGPFHTRAEKSKYVGERVRDEIQEARTPITLDTPHKPSRSELKFLVT